MKNTLLMQAKFNQKANIAMFEMLKNLSEENLDKDCGTFYKSIRAELCHLIGVNVAVFGGVFAKWANVDCGEILNSINADLSVKNTDLDALKALCVKCDEKILEIISNAGELEKMDELSFPGITFKKSRANLILAILNHSLHHRAIIATELDILGISNDFNGMLGYEVQ